MYKKVAVEDGLTNVEQALQAAGYHTTAMDEKSLYNVQAVVVKGDSVDIAAEGNLRVPMVNAAGRTAEEVVEVIRDRLQ